MSEVNWDEVASKADEGIPGLIGKLQRLYDEGRLEMVMCAYAFRDQDGSIVHAYTFEPENDVWAVGLWELTKNRLLSPEHWREAEET